MSSESSMFSQSPETFLYGGPFVPSEYQSLSGTFPGATPQPIEKVLSSGKNETKTETLNAEQIFMMSGNIPNPQPQGSQLPPGGQPKGSQLLPGGQPQRTQLPSGGQTQGNFLPGQTVGQYYLPREQTQG